MRLAGCHRTLSLPWTRLRALTGSDDRASQAAGILWLAVTRFSTIVSVDGALFALFCADQQLSGNAVDEVLILFTILLPA